MISTEVRVELPWVMYKLLMYEQILLRGEASWRAQTQKW